MGLYTWAQKRWVDYWFRPLPLIYLALVRVVLVGFQFGFLIVRDYHGRLVQHAQIADALYNPLPILRFLTMPLGYYRPSELVVQLILVVVFVAGAAAFIGFYTRISLLLFAFGNIFLQAFLYSFGDFHHPNALMMISLLVLSFSPAGELLSIEDLRRRLRKNLAEKRFERVSITSENSYYARWPLLVIQWLFALIYLSAAISKLFQSGLDWMNGYTLQFYMIEDGLRWGSSLGLWVGQHHYLAIVLSWVTIIFEATFFLTLIFPALAIIYVPVGTGFHTGIYLIQRAPFFQFIAAYTVFLPAIVPVVGRLFRHNDSLSVSRNKYIVRYSGQCALCIRQMTILSYLDWFGRLVFQESEENPKTLTPAGEQTTLPSSSQGICLLMPNGQMEKGAKAYRIILRNLPLLWPLALVNLLSLNADIGVKLGRLMLSGRSEIHTCNSS
jgi:predicted DCC family thiol-disulfide oxidoreductase YuxK